MIDIGQYLIAHHWSCPGDPEDQVVTYGLKTEGIELSIEGTLSAVKSAFDNSYFGVAGSMRGGWIYKGFVAQRMFPEGMVTYEKPETRLGLGTNTNALPSNCALLIQKVTGLGGRRNRGRMYLPSAYLPEDVVDSSGYIGSSSLTALQAGATEWRNGLATGDIVMVIHHVDSQLTSTEVTDLRVAPQIATQRRRMRH